MGVAERFKDLISATQRHAIGLNFKLELEFVPEERQYPIVFRCESASAAVEDQAQCKLVLLFVPGETMLTSDVLADIIRRIRQSQMESAKHVLLFAEEDIRLLRRTLEASGLGRYTDIHSYSYRNGQFDCDWMELPYTAEGLGFELRT